MSEFPARQPIAQSPLSAILTAFNAGAEAEEAAAAWDVYLASLSRPYEILLVNDGSTDDTGPRADRLAGQNPHLRIFHHAQHAGVGAALRTGLEHASHPLVITAPCDKQFHPPDLYRILESIDQVDLVAGYRVGPPVPAWLKLWDAGVRLVARILLGATRAPRDSWPGLSGWRRRWLARWIFGVRVQDPECPFRLYRREIFKRLPIQCRSSAAQIEVLAKANHLEFIMAEVPVSWVPPRNMPVDPVDTGAGKELRQLFSAPDFGPAPLIAQ
jgi:glycosyltransferase involved in cell wall biosynthesis